MFSLVLLFVSLLLVAVMFGDSLSHPYRKLSPAALAVPVPEEGH
jgi:hypothetical protein